MDYNILIEQQLKQLAIGRKSPAGLYEPVDYVMAAGGKRVRPVLVLMACHLFADDLQNALMPAVALEVFHNFTLLHDDLMDRADVRRNRPTVHKRWNETTAILSGDAMLILAYQYICRTQPALLPALLNLFSHTAMEVCRGQQYDMDFEQRSDVSINEYLEMIRLKTAVLLAACLKTGALCGGASDTDADALYRFGVELGVAFQIQDDLLDVYADPNIFGKAIGGDILSAKKTYLLLTAFAKADRCTRETLQQILTDREMPSADKINRVKDLYRQLDISRDAQQAIDRHYHAALTHLNEVNLPDPSRKAPLKEFAANLMKREK